MRSAVLAAVFSAIAALGAGFPRAAHACSVCQAGDPIFSGGAATPGEGGSLSLYLEQQGYRKTSALLAEEPGEAPEAGREVNEGRQLNALLAWGATDRLTFSAQLPFRFNRISEEPDEEAQQVSRLTGPGDLSLTAGYVLWRNRDVLPSTWLELRLLGKAPTGQREQRASGKLDPHLQLGTGSWDYGIGLGSGHRMEWGTLYASVLYRENRQGALRYRYGNVFLANLALEAPLGHLTGRPADDAMTAGLELNYRGARRDDFGGHGYGDSGGGIVYATPSLRMRLPWQDPERALQVRFAAQLPLGQGELRGEQHEGVVWSIGFVVPLR